MRKQSPPPYAATALALSVKQWNSLGLEDDDAETCPTSDLSVLVERVTALLLVRCVAITARPHEYADLSTTTICRTALMRQEAWSPPISDELISQIRNFVHSMLVGYKDVPYHNREHAYHVIISSHKMMDLMLSEKGNKTFGLRHDPLLLFSLLFAALVHDVEHQGIPNRQLASEDSVLAVLYNDQSIAENRSLCLAFEELLKDDYKVFRDIIFYTHSPENSATELYHRFRRQVIILVLNTDIASPERTQLAKSKWKEAFGSSEVDHPLDVDQESVTNDGTSTSEDDLDQKLADTKIDETMAEPITPSTPVERSPRRSVQRRHYSMFTRYPESPSITEQGRRSYSRCSMTVLADVKSPKAYRKRLGIRMSMDLSGEALELYRRGGVAPKNQEELDEFKASVILEIMLTAADVAHNLQGWGQMVLWSGRLYLELQRAFLLGRGGDPKVNWYVNQLGFLESYLLPLAKRLDETGVFGDTTGKQFAAAVESNRDMWLIDGMKVTQDIVSKGEEMTVSECATINIADGSESGSSDESEESSGSSTPDSTEDSGSSSPDSTDDSGSSAPDSTEDSGSSILDATKNLGSSVPEATEISASFTPQATEDVGSPIPDATENSHSFLPQATEESVSSAIPQATALVEREIEFPNIIIDKDQKKENEFDSTIKFWLFTVLIVVAAVLFGIALQVLHVKLSLPIRRGQVVPPGTWLSRCGILLGFFSSSAPCENAYLNVDANGFVTLFNANHMVVWEMQGGTCNSEESSHCVEGLTFSEDRKLYVGSKRIESIVEFIDSVPLSPWPFAYEPVVKRRRLNDPEALNTDSNQN